MAGLEDLGGRGPGGRRRAEAQGPTHPPDVDLGPSLPDPRMGEKVLDLRMGEKVGARERVERGRRRLHHSQIQRRRCLPIRRR